MTENRNFLIGYGERLTEPIAAIPKGGASKTAYSFSESRHRLLPMFQQTVLTLQELPDLACPHDETVAVLTLHPQYIAKSYYPEDFLRQFDLEAVGSRPQTVKPEKWSKKSDPKAAVTTEIFIAGSRRSFKELVRQVPGWNEESSGAADLLKIEQFKAVSPEEKLMPMPEDIQEAVFEVVLHAPPIREANFILEGFEDYLKDYDAKPDFDRRLYAGGLCFLPLQAQRETLPEIAKFSFLRVARLMPRLRPLNPLLRSTGLPKRIQYELPEGEPIDREAKAVVFDGGIPVIPGLKKWTARKKAEGVGTPVEEYLEHGLSVTSALLFGSIKEGQPLEQPYGFVDHYRVLDESAESDPYELYDVLSRIKSILQRREYEFVNLSIGPDLSVEDGEVHAWTAVLDDLFSGGDMLATVAVGNTGECDSVLGYNRVQVPSDCVNALSVGAANSRSKSWQRAPYSSVGPGRSPGLVKPDILSFGGSENECFHVIAQEKGLLAPVQGTSFAAPSALRMAVGIRAHFGSVLSPLAIKALLIHCSKDGGYDHLEAGWGRIPDRLEEFVVCPEGTARIVYQGELSPAQFLRAHIPLPVEELNGNVTIQATFCYTTEVDPQDPGNYTRSGLEIVFRPHDGVFSSEEAHHPKSEPFFQRKLFSTEEECRHDAHKWEPTLHQKKRKRGSSLRNPLFDIHYNARAGGAPSKTANKIRYALIISVVSPSTKNIYDKIIHRYRTQLLPLQPKNPIPIRAMG